MVTKEKLNPTLGPRNSGHQSLYAGGLYTQINHSEKCIGRTRNLSFNTGGFLTQVVFSTGSTVYGIQQIAHIDATKMFKNA